MFKKLFFINKKHYFLNKIKHQLKKNFFNTTYKNNKFHHN